MRNKNKISAKKILLLTSSCFVFLPSITISCSSSNSDYEPKPMPDGDTNIGTNLDKENVEIIKNATYKLSLNTKKLKQLEQYLITSRNKVFYPYEIFKKNYLDNSKIKIQNVFRLELEKNSQTNLFKDIVIESVDLNASNLLEFKISARSLNNNKLYSNIKINNTFLVLNLFSSDTEYKEVFRKSLKVNNSNIDIRKFYNNYFNQDLIISWDRNKFKDLDLKPILFADNDGIDQANLKTVFDKVIKAGTNKIPYFFNLIYNQELDKSIIPLQTTIQLAKPLAIDTLLVRINDKGFPQIKDEAYGLYIDAQIIFVKNKNSSVLDLTKLDGSKNFFGRKILGHLDLSIFDQIFFAENNDEKSTFKNNSITKLSLPKITKTTRIPKEMFANNFITNVDFQNSPYQFYLNSFDFQYLNSFSTNPNLTSSDSYNGVKFLNFNQTTLLSDNNSLLFQPSLNNSELIINENDSLKMIYSKLYFFKNKLKNKSINKLVINWNNQTWDSSFIKLDSRLSSLNLDISIVEIRTSQKHVKLANFSSWTNQLIIDKSVIDLEIANENIFNFSQMNIERKFSLDILNFVQNKKLIINSSFWDYFNNNLATSFDPKNLYRYFSRISSNNYNQDISLFNSIEYQSLNNQETILTFNQLVDINYYTKNLYLNQNNKKINILIKKDIKKVDINPSDVSDPIYAISRQIPNTTILGSTQLDLSTQTDLTNFYQNILFCDLSQIQKINFPSNKNQQFIIGNSAFKYLEFSPNFNLALPDNIIEIKASAFSYTKLNTISSSSNIKIDAKAFENSKISEASFKNAKTIESYAFAHSNQLKKVDLSSVEIIPSYCFYNSTSLSTVSAPLVTSIDNSAFFNCALVSANFPKAQIIGSSAFSYNKLENITFNELRTLGSAAFSNNNFLTKATLGSQLSILESSTFDSCTKLVEVIAPNIVQIKDRAFYNCSLVNANFPLVESIGVAAFFSNNLTNISFEKLTTLGDSAFSNNNFLTKANLGSQLSILESSTFDSCTKLVEVIAPNIAQIKDRAFYNCSSLTLLNSFLVTTIGNSAFENASKIGISLLNKFSQLNSIGSRAFVGTAITNPAAFLESKTLLNWEFDSFNFSSIKTSNIKSLEISKYINLNTGIWDFSLYTKTKTSAEFLAMLKDGLKKLSYQNLIINELILPQIQYDKGILSSNFLAAFEAFNIKKILIPNTVEVLGIRCFYNLNGIEEIVFEPNSKLWKIESYVFGPNAALRQISFPTSLKEIQENAFVKVDNLLVSISNQLSDLKISANAFSSSAKVIREDKLSTGLNNIGFYLKKDNNQWILDFSHFSLTISDKNEKISLNKKLSDFLINEIPKINYRIIKKIILPLNLRFLNSNTLKGLANLSVSSTNIELDIGNVFLIKENIFSSTNSYAKYSVVSKNSFNQNGIFKSCDKNLKISLIN